MRSQPRNFIVASAQGVRPPEGNNAACYPMARRRAAYSTGSTFVARSKRMALKPERPASWVGRRRPKARETRAWAECEAGVGGPRSSDDTGERVTPDPV